MPPALPSSSQGSLNYKTLKALDHIRLLRIDSGTSDRVSVSFEEIGLGDSIAHECLSYTRDGPKVADVGEEWTTNHKCIVCDGGITCVRQNLYDALVQMRDMGILGPIWIDALCINQNDIEERNSQVGQMGLIHKAATRVIVWLGRDDENTAPVLTCFRRATVTVADYLKDQSIARRTYDCCNYTQKSVIILLRSSSSGDGTRDCGLFKRRCFHKI